MPESNHSREQVEELRDAIMPAATDRELLENIYQSQMRTEQMVSDAIAAIRPSIEKFSKSGMLGLLGRI